MSHTVKLAKYGAAHTQAGVNTGRHGQVKQYARQHVVAPIERDTSRSTDKVGAIFTLREPARGFTGCTTLRQRKH